MLLGEQMTEETEEETKDVVEVDFLQAIKVMEKKYSKPLTQEKQTEFNKKTIGMLYSMGQEIEELFSVLQSISMMETMKIMGKMLKSFADATEKGEQITIQEEREIKGSVIYS